LILSVETLCYFGDLTLVLLGATHALGPGGMLAFTLQDAGDKTVNWQLNCQGRYSHNQGCVTRMAEDSGFSLMRFDSVTLRKEGGEPVEGHLVAATI
jgi:predicted TPR repeat methyltransferase